MIDDDVVSIVTDKDTMTMSLVFSGTKAEIPDNYVVRVYADIRVLYLDAFSWGSLPCYGQIRMGNIQSATEIDCSRHLEYHNPCTGCLDSGARLPGPIAFRLVTSMILPPRPPTDEAPAPWAPGKAGT